MATTSTSLLPQPAWANGSSTAGMNGSGSGSGSTMLAPNAVAGPSRLHHLSTSSSAAPSASHSASPSPCPSPSSSSAAATAAAKTSARNRTRFFPPPFRIDHTEVVLPSSRAGGQQSRFGTSEQQDGAAPIRLPPVKRPKKKRRLLFTSQLPPPNPSEGEGGIPSVEMLRYRSSVRLKTKWDSIYDRFKDAHLIKQDEIYLGRGRERMRILRDNGVIRALKEEVFFGSFHVKEEDLDDVEIELRKAAGKDAEEIYGHHHLHSNNKNRSSKNPDRDSSDDARSNKPTGTDSGADVAAAEEEEEDELEAWDPDFLQRQYPELSQNRRGRRGSGGNGRDGEAHASSSNSEDNINNSDNSDPDSDSDSDQDAAAANDPELRAFLEAERKRKELMGSEEEEEDSDVEGYGYGYRYGHGKGNSVIDFRAPEWNRTRGNGSSSSDDDHDDDNSTDDSEHDDDHVDDGDERDGYADGDETLVSHGRRKTMGPATLHLARPGLYDSSDDEMDVLIQGRSQRERGGGGGHDVGHSAAAAAAVDNVHDDYRRAMERKRQNVEDALQALRVHGDRKGGDHDDHDDEKRTGQDSSRSFGRALPYSDIPGLADLLGIVVPESQAVSLPHNQAQEADITTSAAGTAATTTGAASPSAKMPSTADEDDEDDEDDRMAVEASIFSSPLGAAYSDDDDDDDDDEQRKGDGQGEARDSAATSAPAAVLRLDSVEAAWTDAGPPSFDVHHAAAGAGAGASADTVVATATATATLVSGS